MVEIRETERQDVRFGRNGGDGPRRPADGKLFLLNDQPRIEPAPAPEPQQPPAPPPAQMALNYPPQRAVPAGYDAADPVMIHGKVERIDFAGTKYTVFVRASSSSPMGQRLGRRPTRLSMNSTQRHTGATGLQ